MKYLIIDGYLNGTGIRDKINGGYLSPDELNLSSELILKLNVWLKKYWAEFYQQYHNHNAIMDLDIEGIEIANMIKKELNNVKIEYFSDAKMEPMPLEEEFYLQKVLDK